LAHLTPYRTLLKPQCSKISDHGFMVDSAPLPTNPNVVTQVSDSDSILAEIRQRLRVGQRAMADWQSGPLAVSAVPGSGKSTGMAGAAAIALGRWYQSLQAGGTVETNTRRQLIVVTFTRSAAANLKAKIQQNLRLAALPPLGFTVQTLHGLALNIALRHPERSGLYANTFTLLTPSQHHRLVRTAVEQWIEGNLDQYHQLIEGCSFDGEEAERLRRQTVLRTEVLPDLAREVIHEAKSSGLLPKHLRQMEQSATQRLENPASIAYPVLTIAAGLYEKYQSLLQARSLIDYDDMILAALRVLQDADTQAIWQQQVLAVFEDEAQDSSPLQTQLLGLLAQDSRDAHQLNWMRVGDPNQAINSTFTPADPLFFRQFCAACARRDRLITMTQAGRSTELIMTAANFVLNWVNQFSQRQFSQRQFGQQPSRNDPHPDQNLPQLATSPLPFRRQYIEPVPANDPQPNANPPAIGGGLELWRPVDIHETADQIGRRVIDLLRDYPEASAAVLVRENRQGEFLAGSLRDRLTAEEIPIYEVGQRDRRSHVPGEMLTLLRFIDRPHSPDYLKAALQVLMHRRLIPSQDLNAIAPQPEQFLYPGLLEMPLSEAAQLAQKFCTRLLQARLALSPADLISFLAVSLNYDASELATADKLADRINRQTLDQPGLRSTLEVLASIVSAETFEPVETDQDEARYTRSGQLTIITMHKAKGLDWDFVFLPFLHKNVIPGDQWISPAQKFLGNFTLSAVARAQIRMGLHAQLRDRDPLDPNIYHRSSGELGLLERLPNLEEAWITAGELKLAEEFRLLYVAMTRAKRLLWMSAAQQAPFRWTNWGNLESQEPCPIFPALQTQFPDSVFL